MGKWLLIAGLVCKAVSTVVVDYGPAFLYIKEGTWVRGSFHRDRDSTRDDQAWYLQIVQLIIQPSAIF